MKNRTISFEEALVLSWLAFSELRKSASAKVCPDNIKVYENSLKQARKNARAGKSISPSLEAILKLYSEGVSSHLGLNEEIDLERLPELNPFTFWLLDEELNLQYIRTASLDEFDSNVFVAREAVSVFSELLMKNNVSRFPNFLRSSYPIGYERIFTEKSYAELEQELGKARIEHGVKLFLETAEIVGKTSQSPVRYKPKLRYRPFFLIAPLLWVVARYFITKKEVVCEKTIFGIGYGDRESLFVDNIVGVKPSGTLFGSITFTSSSGTPVTWRKLWLPRRKARVAQDFMRSDTGGRGL